MLNNHRDGYNTLLNRQQNKINVRQRLEMHNITFDILLI